MALIFVYIGGCCVVFTSVFDFGEHVVRQSDPIWLNLLLMSGMTALVCVAVRYAEHIPIKAVIITFFAGTAVLGFIWVQSISAVPKSDSAACYTFALDLINGEMPALEYHRSVPHQCGFTLYCELFIRLFGENCYHKIQYVNVLCLMLSNAAVLVITWDMLKSRRALLAATLMLAICIQLFFYCGFIYGILPGLALSLWAIVLLMRYVKRGKVWRIIAAAALGAVAVVLKPNSWIIVIAGVLTSALWMLSTRRFRTLALLLIPLALPY